MRCGPLDKHFALVARRIDARKERGLTPNASKRADRSGLHLPALQILDFQVRAAREHRLRSKPASVLLANGGAAGKTDRAGAQIAFVVAEAHLRLISVFAETRNTWPSVVIALPALKSLAMP